MTAIARFKDLCLDANDPALLGRFWASVLDRTWEPDDAGEGRLVGRTPQHTLWINRVPEAKTVKHRVHFDVYGAGPAADSRVVLPEGGDRAWTVMADPEYGEYCLFLRERPPADRMHGLVVDSVDPAAQAEWWAAVYGAEVVHDKRGHSTVQNVPGMPILTMDFVPVPEPKTVKNRIHWDVDVHDPALLVEAGALVLRPPGEVRWHVMADPEGNEFCAFTG
jgi:hypothetical protein